MERLDKPESIEEARQRWEAAFKLQDSPEVCGDLGIEVAPIYTPADLKDFDYLEQLGFPGQYPFTRGPYPEMSRHRPWRYALFTGFDTPEKTNERWKHLYKAGQPSFNIVYDLATHLGIDSDDPRAEDEVGRVGIPIDTLRDWEALWQDLPMEGVPFNNNIETLGAVIIAFHVALAEKRGIAPSKLWGSVSNDPLSTAVSKGTTVFPLEHGVRLAVDLIEYCTRHMPKFFPVNLKAVNMAEGGASAAQEIGYVFSNAFCLLDEAVKRGLPADDVASKFSFFGCSTTHLFEEVAKWRAARRYWARAMKNRYGCRRPASMAFRFTGFHNPLWLYPEDPQLNLVRAAIGALACALAGAQAMPHPGLEEAYSIPTERSQELALGTQQILAEETNITKTVDPLGGSYYVEWLTNKMEEKIAQEVEDIEKQGGAVKAITEGYMQRLIFEHFRSQQEAIRTGERVVVRKNKYRLETDQEVADRIELHKIDEQAVKQHKENLRKVKAERDGGQVARCLSAIRKAAETKDNLMPHLIEAARAYVSIGEITGALKEVWGVYREPSAWR